MTRILKDATTVTSEKVLGQIRELLVAVGLVLFQFGITNESLWEQISGALLALIVLIFSIKQKEGKEKLFTSLRKVLSATGGLLTSFGVLAESQINAIIGVIVLVIPLVWSWVEKGEG